MNLMYLHSLCFLARKHPNAFIEELENGKVLNKEFKISKRLKNKLVKYAKRYVE